MDQVPVQPQITSVPGALDNEQKTMAMVAHLLAFAGYFVPFGNIIGPLVLWQMKKDKPFVAEHARESLNFQISVTLYVIASIILMFVVIGIFTLIAVLVFELIVVILAAIKAHNGEPYRYPLCIRLVK